MYAIESSLGTSEPIMLLNQPIGFDPSDPTAPYIDGALFQKELLELDNAGYKAIRIYINSPGGSVVDGYNICNCILKSKTPVDTYNTGMAASMAGIIWMCGRKRVMCDYASLMIHNPFGGADKKMLNALRQSTITILAAKCNMTETDIEYVMDRETWFTSSECLAKGFCTDIEVTSEANQKRMPLVSARAVWKEANLIQNNIFKIDNMAETPTGKVLGTSLIAAFLDLNVDATEGAVLSAVKAKINAEILAKESAEDKATALKKKMDKLQADMDEMSGKYEALMKEKEDGEAKAKKEKETADAKAKKDKEDADAAIATEKANAKKVEAKAMVDVYQKAGKIKAEAVDKWVDMAVKLEVAEVKAMLEELPLNKVAPGAAGGGTAAAKAAGTQGTDAVVDPNITPANAMSYQARIQADVKNRLKTA